MANTLAQECGRLEALNRELLEACKGIRDGVAFGDMGPIQDNAYYLFEWNNPKIVALKAAIDKAEKGV